MLLPVVMVLGGLVCLCCALSWYRPRLIIAASIMCAAMIDHAWIGALAPSLWSGLLVLGAVLLGAELGALRRVNNAAPTECAGVDSGDKRHAEPGAPVKNRTSLGSRVLEFPPDMHGRLHRGHLVLCAVAYMVMAWLLVVHQTSAVRLGGSLGGQTTHHHHLNGDASVVLLIGLSVLVTGSLLALIIPALRYRRTRTAVDSAGMTLMLAAMLAPLLTG